MIFLVFILSTVIAEPNPLKCTAREWVTEEEACITRCGMEARIAYFRGQVQELVEKYDAEPVEVVIDVNFYAGPNLERGLGWATEYRAKHPHKRAQAEIAIEPRYLGRVSYVTIRGTAAHEVSHHLLEGELEAWKKEDGSLFSPKHSIVVGLSIELIGKDAIKAFLQERKNPLPNRLIEKFIKDSQDAYKKHRKKMQRILKNKKK